MTLRLALLGILLPGVAGAAVLRGLVVEHESRAPVAHAIVYVGDVVRAETDEDGRFRLEGLPAGEAKLRIEHVAYQESRRTVRLREGRDTDAVFRLRPKIATLETVEVRTIRPDPSVPQGRRTVSSSQIRRSAGSVATDPIRVVQALPGAAAAAGDDFSNKYVVRGGDPEENRILFDGYPLLQPVHLEGFTSVIYDDLISNVEVFPGALPPRLGDAVSSVTSLSAADPGRPRRFFRYDLGSIAVGGERPSDRTEVIGALRTSFYNLILRRPPGVKKRAFQDLTARGSFDGDRIGASLTVVASRDREEGDIDRDVDALLVGARLGNRTHARSWRIGVSGTERKESAETHRPKSRSRGEERRLGLAGEYEWVVNPAFQARADGEFRFDRYRTLSTTWDDEAAFAAVEGTLARPLGSLSAGGRIEKIPFADGVWASPYLSMRVRAIPRLTLGAAWRTARQTPYPLSEGAEIAGLPVDVDALLDAGEGKLHPIRADHLSASVEVGLSAGFACGIEGYSKRYDDLLSWDASGTTPAGANNRGEGSGKGIEVSLRREGRISGQASFTASRTRKREGGATAQRPADHDRPRMLQVGGEVSISGGTSVALAFRSATGRPITPLVALPNGDLAPGEVNSQRLSSYRRLDIKLEHRIEGTKNEAFLYLDVLNVMNRKNIVDVTQFVGAGGQIVRIYNQGVRILPIAGFGFYF